MLGFILMALRQRRAAQSGDDSDEALMERFRDGDARAFERLLQRHEKAIFNFIYRLVRDRELAGDLTQETFLRVVNGARKYSPKAKFTTWLYTIARNQGIDALRKARHRQHPSLDQPARGEPEGRTLLERLPGGSADGYEAADAVEIRARVERALAELAREQREVFVMREFMQLPFKEIAAVVGCSENTIKSRMRYALENLRLALADYAAELPGGADPVPARSRA